MSKAPAREATTTTPEGADVGERLAVALASLAAAESAAEDGGVEIVRHAPVSVDQVAVGLTLRPRDEAALARALRTWSEHRLAAVVRGGGSQLGVGNSASRVDALLTTDAIRGVTDFERDDGVVHVNAGTPLSELADAMGEAGWLVPLDPPGAHATVGGTLASGAIGPRRLGFGPPRDAVLGLEVVTASGERTRCGGRVVKNVTGYDLAKLYTGSFGTLGVIAGAWLRLRPRPERECVLIVYGTRASRAAGGSDAPFRELLALGLEASRRTTARVSALVSPVAWRALDGSSGGDSEGEEWRLLVELAGDALGVDHDAEWLAGRGGVMIESGEEGDASAKSEPGAAVASLRALQGRTLGDGGVRARIAALPSALLRVSESLDVSAEAVVVHPGVGLAYAWSRDATDSVESLLDACAATARECGGTLRLEALPAWAKGDRDVFGQVRPAERQLMEGLKRQFDPQGVLNPGRFAGGI